MTEYFFVLSCVLRVEVISVEVNILLASSFIIREFLFLYFVSANEVVLQDKAQITSFWKSLIDLRLQILTFFQEVLLQLSAIPSISPPSPLPKITDRLLGRGDMRLGGSDIIDVAIFKRRKEKKSQALGEQNKWETLGRSAVERMHINEVCFQSGNNAADTSALVNGRKLKYSFSQEYGYYLH